MSIAEEHSARIEELTTDLEFANKQIDDIRAKVDYYYEKRTSEDWLELLDDIMAVLER